MANTQNILYSILPWLERWPKYNNQVSCFAARAQFPPIKIKKKNGSYGDVNIMNIIH